MITPPSPSGGAGVVLTHGLGLNRGQEVCTTKQSWPGCGPVHGGPILSAPVCPARQSRLVVRVCEISSWENSVPSCCTSLQPSPFSSHDLIPWGPLFPCSDSPRGRPGHSVSSEYLLCLGPRWLKALRGFTGKILPSLATGCDKRLS